MKSQSPSPNPTNMKTTTPSRLLSLPDELVLEIMSRLPLSSMSSSKLACKRLLSLASDPELAFLPSSVSRTSLLYAFPSGCLALFDLQGGGKAFSHRIRIREGHFANTCNGFLCVFSPADRQVKVCNPILGESMTLPYISNCDEVCGAYIGFVASEKRYKVLAVVCHGKPPYVGSYEARVYMIGGNTASWRSLGPVPFDDGLFAFHVKYLDTYVNGNTHWLDIGEPGKPLVIRAFDFESEKFRVVPHPGTPDCDAFKFGVVKGCLAFCGLQYTWIMKEYGVKESWTKVSRVVNPLSRFWVCRWLMGDKIRAVSLIPSLVSLRFIANRENVEIDVRQNDDEDLAKLGRMEIESIKEHLQPPGTIEQDWLKDCCFLGQCFSLG